MDDLVGQVTILNGVIYVIQSVDGDTVTLQRVAQVDTSKIRIIDFSHYAPGLFRSDIEVMVRQLEEHGVDVSRVTVGYGGFHRAIDLDERIFLAASPRKGQARDTSDRALWRANQSRHQYKGRR